MYQFITGTFVHAKQADICVPRKRTDKNKTSTATVLSFTVTLVGIVADPNP
jgi:hypothetical protein